MPKFDFAVIGTGIAGASFAARVGRHARVLLLEREPFPAYHSTGRSAALYSALYGNGPITALTRASRAFFDAPPQGFAEHALLRPRGVLYIGTERERESVQQIARSPLAVMTVPGDAIARVPVLRPHAATCAAFEAGACDIDVHALHQGFLRMAKAAGTVVVANTEVLALERGASWRIATSSGISYEAEVLVNAAGAWADSVARLAATPALGLQPLRRTAILIDPAQPAGVGHWPAVIAADESFYFKPDAGLLLASPADETPSAPCDAQPEELDIAVCVDRIESATSLQVRRVARAWAGLRTFAPDRTPVVGYDSRVEGFFWLAGQGGYGVQTAPALSEVASALALGKAMPQHIADEGFDESEIAPQRLFSADRKNLSGSKWT